MDKVMQVVEGALANLTPDQNPWKLVHQALVSEVRPSLEQSFLSQMYATSALLAVNAIVLALCILVKWRQGSFWVFKTYRGTGGKYIVVHYSSAFTTFMLIFFGLLQPYIWKSVRYAEGHIVEDSALWRTLVWIPGWTAFYFAAWSLCVSHILHKDSSGRPARSFIASAWFVNTLGVLVPVGLILSVALLAWQTQKHWHQAMEKFVELEAILDKYQSTYTGTLDPTAFSDGVTMGTAGAFASHLADFGTFFRWVFIAYLIWSVLLLSTLVVSATLHLRELKKTMTDLGRRSQMDDDTRAQEEALSRSFAGLKWVTIGIVASCTAICVLFAFVAAAGRKVVYDAMISKVASLLPVWLFAILGFFLSTSFLIRLIRSSSSSPPRSHRDKSEEAFDAVHIPAGERGGVLDTYSTSDPKPPFQDEYPLATLGGNTDDGSPRLCPSTMSQRSGSEAHLVQQQMGGVVEQPYYASYATRQPVMSTEEQGEKGWRA
ncbi:hypothetical protein JCM11251_003026 [Rhodosporidiobolus azoricus]